MILRPPPRLRAPLGGRLVAATVVTSSLALACAPGKIDGDSKDRSQASAADPPAARQGSQRSQRKKPSAPLEASGDGEVELAFSYFEGTLAAAIAAAKSEDKLVFVDIGAYWCHSCHELEEKIFTLPAVGAYIRDNFIAVKLDAEKDEGPELTDRYQVQAYPTLLVLDADGVELGRLLEVGDGSALVAGLTEISQGGDPLTALVAAAKADPEDLEARYRLGLAYALAARRDEAEAAYDQVLAGDPDNEAGLAAKVLYNRATFIVANLDGDSEAAIARYRELQERFAGTQEAIRSMRSMGRELHKLGRPDEAIASLDAMIATAPTDAVLIASYGWFSFRQRCHPESGLRVVDAGLVAEPDNAELHYLKAELSHLVGDDASAVVAMRRASSLEPKTAYYRRQLRRFEGLADASGGA